MFFLFFVFLFFSVMFLLICVDEWSNNVFVPSTVIILTAFLITATCFLGVYNFG